MTTGIINTTGILSEIQTVFVILLAVAACVALWLGFVKGKAGAALGIVAVILVACGIWGIVALFQSGAGGALAGKVADLFIGSAAAPPAAPPTR